MSTPWPNTFPSLSQRLSRPLPASETARLSWTVPAASVDTVPRSSMGMRGCESSASTVTRRRWHMQLSVLQDTEDVRLSGTVGSESGLNSSAPWVWSTQTVCY